MKTKAFLSIIFVLSSLYFASCCKEPHAVAALSITYSNMDTNTYVKAYLTDRNDLSMISDTIALGELHSYNNYTVSIDFEENSMNYILFIENSAYIDTISDVNFDVKGSCKPKIENFSYKFNGQKRTDALISVE